MFGPLRVVDGKYRKRQTMGTWNLAAGRASDGVGLASQRPETSAACVRNTVWPAAQVEGRGSDYVVPTRTFRQHEARQNAMDAVSVCRRGRGPRVMTRLWPQLGRQTTGRCCSQAAVAAATVRAGAIARGDMCGRREGDANQEPRQPGALCPTRARLGLLGPPLPPPSSCKRCLDNMKCPFGRRLQSRTRVCLPRTEDSMRGAPHRESGHAGSGRNKRNPQERSAAGSD